VPRHLQDECVAVFCSALQSVAMFYSALWCVEVNRALSPARLVRCSVVQCVPMCCSVFKCVAMCSNVLQCVVQRCLQDECFAVFCVLQCVAVNHVSSLARLVRCSELQCVPMLTATHCNTLQHTATHCNTLQHTLQHTATHSSPMSMRVA